MTPVDVIADFCDDGIMFSPFVHDVDHFQGGKGLSFRHLINLMPPHDRYIETHLGGGAVIKHKRPAAKNFGIDLDGRVLDRWSKAGRDDVTVLGGCVLELLPSLRPDAATVVYADPPYLRSSRRRGRAYRHDYDESDHRALLSLLNSLTSKVIISGYPSNLYDEMLAGWHCRSYAAVTHRGVVRECAWTNFEPGPILHDYRYVGSGFRERERFRRRSGSLARQLCEADELELNAALASLAEARPDAVINAARRLA